MPLLYQFPLVVKEDWCGVIWRTTQPTEPSRGLQHNTVLHYNVKHPIIYLGNDKELL